MDKILKFSCSSALPNSKNLWLCLEQPGVVACLAALVCQLTPLARFHSRQLETHLYALDLRQPVASFFKKIMALSKRIWLQCVNPPIGSQVTNCHITWDLSGILARCQSTIPGGYQGTSGFLWCSVRIWEDRYTGHSSCKILSQGGLKMIKYWVGPLPLPLDWCISVVLITQTHLRWRILYHFGVKPFFEKEFTF